MELSGHNSIAVTQRYLECCEHEGVGRLAKLYEDFGDVRNDDFRAWWGGSLKRGAKLFAEERHEWTVKKIDAALDWDIQRCVLSKPTTNKTHCAQVSVVKMACALYQATDK